MSTNRSARRWWRLVAVLLAFTVVAAACGSDDDEGSDPPTSEGDTGDTGDTGGDDLVAALDANGDGEVRIGIAAQGPADDGGYYQAIIDQAEQLSADNGFGEIIVVDEITFEEAATELENLANQPVDIILVGASGVADPLPDLSERFPDIYWYCNCGEGFAEGETYSQTGDNGGEIHYTAGVAFGAILQETGGDTVAMLGGFDHEFEQVALMATELGLKSVDPSFEITYTATGDFPFDFDNVANATAAFDAAVAEGADLIYPFLGGALEPVARLAVDAGLPVANPGSSSACDNEIPYDLTIRFDAGDYVAEVFPMIVSGDFPEGSVRTFLVSTDPDIVGAEICSPTDDQAAQVQTAYDALAAGDLAGDLGAIYGEVYGG